ncbi:MAG: sporulation protein YabP [Firmicutes bacterium]|nr:sporulation protein YabP [Bacillota bacterium]MCL5040220.1 sporulation protein YabP [Bacillota bacterium]
MEERLSDPGLDHEVLLSNREQVVIKGVLHVESFDESEIVLDTQMGTLILRGEDLRIKQLNVEDGSFSVEGTFNSLQYTTGGGKRARGKGKGLLDKILR